MGATQDHIEDIRTKVNLETSRIAWKELQRFFASGEAVVVSSELDLVDVAVQMSQDNTAQIRQWMEAGQFGKVSEEQAAAWYATDDLVWAVVVSPWVLVQSVKEPPHP